MIFRFYISFDSTGRACGAMTRTGSNDARHSTSSHAISTPSHAFNLSPRFLPPTAPHHVFPTPSHMFSTPSHAFDLSPTYFNHNPPPHVFDPHHMFLNHSRAPTTYFASSGHTYACFREFFSFFFIVFSSLHPRYMHMHVPSTS